MMTKQELIKWALGRGWKQDKYGHLQNLFLDREYRLKIGKISVRYEKKISSGWLRMRSGYFKDLSLDREGKLKGLK